ncbi:hypothetical protein IKE67_04685 [bacterium]|nr:hypothetical protein [bacterium]
MADENNNNLNKKIQSATNPNLTQNKVYSKQYYIMFYTIMVTSFTFMYWLCNFTKLKEMFQIVAITAVSIAIAEFVTRKYLKL